MTDYRVRNRCHMVTEGKQRCTRVARHQRENLYFCRQHHDAWVRLAENPHRRPRVFAAVEYLP
jgi:hypothetical protein